MSKRRREAVARTLGGDGTCAVRFRVSASGAGPQPGGSVRLVGSAEALGGWAVGRAVALLHEAGDVWTAEVELPRGRSARVPAPWLPFRP